MGRTKANKPRFRITQPRPGQGADVYRLLSTMTDDEQPSGWQGLTDMINSGAVDAFTAATGLRYLVAEKNGTVIGAADMEPQVSWALSMAASQPGTFTMAMVKALADLVPVLDKCAVDPRHRRQGVGTALVKAMRDQARENHVALLYSLVANTAWGLATGGRLVTSERLAMIVDTPSGQGRFEMIIPVDRQVFVHPVAPGITITQSPQEFLVQGVAIRRWPEVTPAFQHFVEAAAMMPPG
ncbi:GNAT family N-acetyltransferase [Kitasatospora sp. NPDC096140]|uniref:GNAT family N-acetyltransferase n=1 Tax=Kitasatospora sp. NPDC096140 TaxID=3155425 RepID=UPI0033310451